MAHIEFRKPKPPSLFRRIAIGTWTTAYDPSVYGAVEIPMEPALAYMKKFEQTTGLRCTVSHFMVKAAAICLEKTPQANAMLRFNRVYERERINVFSHVAIQGDGDMDKLDVTGFTVRDANEKSLRDIAQEFEEKMERARKREDTDIERGRRTFRLIPPLLLNRFLKTLSFFGYTLNLDLSALGMPKDPFGSITITNIGSLGLTEAYVPLIPYTRVPLSVAIGSIREIPVVRGGQVVPGQCMRCHITFDHRVIDGAHGAALCKDLLEIFADPERFMGTPTA